MPVDSWTPSEETPALAATATAMIDAALTGTGLSGEVYWAAVRKGYNTPYNDPPRKAAPAPAVIAIAGAGVSELQAAPPEPAAATPDLPVAAMASALAAEVHAG